MLIFLERLSVDFEAVRRDHLPEDLVRFHFTSKRKRMSTLTINNGETLHSYDRRLHTKGAAEQVLLSCTHYLDESGSPASLSEEIKESLN